MINGNKVSYEDSGLSKREWNELMIVIDKKNLIAN
jgi:thymidylate synthase (FAD)